ncbi:hypothetical protein SARC_05340 [Sphaeroforma arctica JP610]|uniref:Uncharacterized protein n=1 Tax=Sphaeroforma arctica JP610 TaxID=667725 RepID=A0A0L0G0I3_9EUKA|nr:hypothetical protein SARC_05340 [Sphaeroforma arctica JP610]KNC82369.1 hypothetical protein SARC_05340 [Sphaeroforma arctica JP610]|eukprot:XP_014156271.1 hypothetical protein SARC_05340 [Sphaeroforma arctica JP610]
MIFSIVSRIPVTTRTTTTTMCRTNLPQSQQSASLHTRSPLKVLSAIEANTATRIPKSSTGGIKVLNSSSKNTAATGSTTIEVGQTTRNMTCTTRSGSKTQLSAGKARKPSKPSYMSSTYFENERVVFGNDF